MKENKTLKVIDDVCVNSAVFHQGNIVAAFNGTEQQLRVIDPLTHEEVNSIEILNDSDGYDKCMIYQLCQTECGNLLAFGAWFESEDDLASLYGVTALFWLGKSINKSASQDSVSAEMFIYRKSSASETHQNDVIIPMSTIHTVEIGPGDSVLFAQQNHCVEPYMIRINQGKLTEIYEMSEGLP